MLSKISKKMILIISFCCMIYSIIVLAFFIVSFADKDMLLKLFDRFHIYDNLPFNIPMEDVKKFVYELMDFLQCKKEFLDTKVMIDGVETSFYTYTSATHMNDCRRLYVVHGYYALYMLIPAIFGITYVIMLDKTDWQKRLFDTYKQVFIAFVIFLGITIIFAVCSFNNFFTLFHQIFFKNDLWLFDPTKDYIINYLPPKIFITLGIRIVIITSLLLLVIFCLLYFLKKNQSHLKAK